MPRPSTLHDDEKEQMLDSDCTYDDALTICTSVVAAAVMRLPTTNSHGSDMSMALSVWTTTPFTEMVRTPLSTWETIHRT